MKAANRFAQRHQVSYYPSLRLIASVVASIIFGLTLFASRSEADSYTLLHTFDSGYDAGIYEAPLLLSSDGNFYGSTPAGGTAGQGSLYKLSPSGTFTTLHSFGDGSVVNDGATPSGPLIEGPDGNFYGTTVSGGSATYGTVFRMSPTGVVTILHSFVDGIHDGGYPYGGVILGSDGNLYGTTSDGAPQGIVYKMTLDGEETILYGFGSTGSTFNGVAPSAGLVQGTDGNFYGTTYVAGGAGTGAAFQMTPSGTVMGLHTFGVGTDGYIVSTPLIQGLNGDFYGTTRNGGLFRQGVVFDLSSNGTYSILCQFGDSSGPVTADDPYGPVIQASDGNLYTTTENGGAGHVGTVCQITTGGVLSILHSFADGSVTNDGANPRTAVIQGTDGNLYGVCDSGGTGNGVVFKLSVGLPATAPVKPTAVTVTGANLRETLSWHVSSAATTYNIYRSTTSGGEGLTPYHSDVTGLSFAESASAGTYYYQVTAVNTAGESAKSAEVSVALAPPTVSFVRPDKVTQGNWKGVYGSDGYNVIGDTSPGNPYYPSYATVATGTKNSGVWAQASLNQGCLQKPINGSPVRTAGVWYQTSWTMTVNVQGQHQVALYLFDIHNAGYAETITIRDAVKGTVLDTQTASNFSGGVYYVWNISGEVTFTLTSTAGHWAVLSGLFFGPATGSNAPDAPTLTATPASHQVTLSWPAASGATSYDVYRGSTAGGESTTPIATGITGTSYKNTGLTAGATYYYEVVAVNAVGGSFASNEVSPAIPVIAATFVKSDSTTQGNWKGKYGADGYNVIGDTSGTNPVYPVYATVTPGTHYSGIWAASSTLPNCLQKVATASTTRIAGVWYQTSWWVNVNVTGSHQLALYLLDYPRSSYGETITIKDAVTGSVLDTRSAERFANGIYYVWNVSGNVTITLTSTSGHWAVVSGIFFG